MQLHIPLPSSWFSVDLKPWAKGCTLWAEKRWGPLGHFGNVKLPLAASVRAMKGHLCVRGGCGGVNEGGDGRKLWMLMSSRKLTVSGHLKVMHFYHTQLWALMQIYTLLWQEAHDSPHMIIIQFTHKLITFKLLYADREHKKQNEEKFHLSTEAKSHIMRQGDLEFWGDPQEPTLAWIGGTTFAPRPDALIKDSKSSLIPINVPRSM